MGLTTNSLCVQVSPPNRAEGFEFSITEVRNALRCPRSVALGRLRGEAAVFPLGSSSLSAMFCRIVERGTATLAPSNEGAPREQTVRTVADGLLKQLLHELETTPEAAMMPGEVDDLAEALRQLAAAAAPSALRAPSGEAPSADGDGALRMEMTSAKGAPTVLSGRREELFGTGGGGPGVVEFKLADEASQELDRAQIALYRAIVQAALGLDAVPTLFRCAPKLASTILTAAEADILLERKVLPLLDEMIAWSEQPKTAPPTARRDLCPACPMRAACAETFPEWLDARDNALAGATRPMPDAGGRLAVVAGAEPNAPVLYDIVGKAEADEMANRIKETAKRLKVGLTIQGTKVGPRVFSIEVLCPKQRVTLLDRAAADVEHQLSKEEVSYDRIGARRFFRVRRKDPRPIPLEPLLARAAPYLRERPGRFLVGEKMDGDPLVGDFSDGSSCHLLVGGQTGSGKSVLLCSMISSLCHFHPPTAIRFILVDPKRVTFSRFAGSVASHLSAPVFYDVEAFLPALEDLVIEMEARYERMEACRAQNIDEYNASSTEKLARRVIVVDEFQDLVATKALRVPFIDAVRRLGSKARAAGIHLILATQRPDKNTVPGEIKVNLCGRIALRVQEAVNSRIILDQAGAEKLLGRGDLLADLGHGVVRAQAPIG